MKNTIWFILLPICFIWLIGCNNAHNSNENKNQNNIWLFHIGQSKSEVEAELISNHYDVVVMDNNVIGTTNPTINYLDIDWDNVAITFENDLLVSISFMRHLSVIGKSAPLSQEKLFSLKENISEKYGEMRENRKESDKDIKLYVWFGKDVFVELGDMFDGEIINLSYFKEGHNPRDYK